MFQTCLVENPSVHVVCFENHAEWRFCLAPFVCRALLAHWRPVGAVALGWRSGARACCPFPLLISLCTCALCRTFMLTHATALKPSHSNKSYPLHHVQHTRINTCVPASKLSCNCCPLHVVLNKFSMTDYIDNSTKHHPTKFITACSARILPADGRQPTFWATGPAPTNVLGQPSEPGANHPSRPPGEREPIFWATSSTNQYSGPPATLTNILGHQKNSTNQHSRPPVKQH